eukprot:TRINITY_DN3063_c0_g2_i1.p1 TRINITY_DN3063_c0_g2~~TRINITY_DN3063_c0_g2_i1.p1  ORF type:complete len:423 (-),score=37.12 TRINITY_DN3063_c0_g2_i1:1357-2625(-)
MSRLASCMYVLFSLLLSQVVFAQRVQSVSGELDEQGQVTDVQLADARLALDLLGKSDLCGWNCVFSPFSIKSVMMLVVLGLQDNTTMRETLSGLRLDDIGAQAAHSAHSNLLSEVLLSSNKRSTISIANTVFANDKYELKRSYQRAARELYSARAQSADFSNPQAVVQEVNGWVANQTQNHIKNLLNLSQVNEMTAAILVNAIFFKGIWKTEFNPMETTTGQPFYFGSAASEIASVDMMHVKDTFCFDLQRGGDLKFDVIELPYGDGDIVMTILKPYAPLNEALKAIQDQDLLFTFLDLPTCGEVEVYMPKFTIQQKSDLKVVMQALGINSIFEPESAQLYEMVQNNFQQLYISEAVHQAKIEVDEKGTTAAASSAMLVMFESAMVVTPVFRVDQPFFFIMYHKPTKTILFMGQVVNPSMEQ